MHEVAAQSSRHPAHNKVIVLMTVLTHVLTLLLVACLGGAAAIMVGIM
ncbi:MAG: hypothetical protein JWM91_1240 [Rhodospirillales bacterium]|nr:hypothetical protein [Rhodospirillales bacterium]